MAMEIEKLRRNLSEIALHPGQYERNELISHLALALLHIAEGLEDVRRRLPTPSTSF
jgi:hypothetical protein